MTCSFDEVWRATFACLTRPMVTVCPQEKADYMARSMHLCPTNKVSTDNAETLQLWQARGRDWRVGVRCLRVRHGPMTSCEKVWRAMLSGLARPADGDGVSPGEGWPPGSVDAFDSREPCFFDESDSD